MNLNILERQSLFGLRLIFFCVFSYKYNVTCGKVHREFFFCFLEHNKEITTGNGYETEIRIYKFLFFTFHTHKSLGV